jgi:hypothetical protein
LGRDHSYVCYFECCLCCQNEKEIELNRVRKAPEGAGGYYLNVDGAEMGVIVFSFCIL